MTKQGTSDKLAAQSARLAAVQTVYQISMNKEPAVDAVRGYLERYAGGMEVEGERIAEPDRALFSEIVRGVEERFDDLKSILEAQYKREDKSMEPLLQAILLCGIYEILAHHEVDGPILVNDYLNIAHEFYDKGEVSLINGILDSCLKSIR